ncbi:MAG: DUF763 domain-containing protein [Actinobacteria bacterium]|nr:DUF763 domain-containing protein [Actinomycetota bacterium]MCL6094486.1 DUF763 domain-containing protein [Actinomycetota bacterium]
MRRTGFVDSPLHTGKAPRWLFERMVSLAREVSIAIVQEHGPQGILERLANPLWFQAFGCVLGFDWHSSGLTTTVTGALKQAWKSLPREELGVVAAGGKGKSSLRTPVEIREACETTGQDAEQLVMASRLSAKVDSAALQDGFDLYHHSFFFTAQSEWVVVQQGMNPSSRMARRYHWSTTACFDRDPHAAVAGTPATNVLNLVAGEAEGNRAVIVELSKLPPVQISKELNALTRIELPRHHLIRLEDIHPDRVSKVLLNSYESQPEDFTSLLATRGVGASGLRALSLVAELVYGKPASVRDPVSYSFAHGGKDGTPYPVNREVYDSTIESLRKALMEARLARTEKVSALKRLAGLAVS